MPSRCFVIGVWMNAYFGSYLRQSYNSRVSKDCILILDIISSRVIQRMPTTPSREKVLLELNAPSVLYSLPWVATLGIHWSPRRSSSVCVWSFCECKQCQTDHISDQCKFSQMEWANWVDETQSTLCREAHADLDDEVIGIESWVTHYYWHLHPPEFAAQG